MRVVLCCLSVTSSGFSRSVQLSGSTCAEATRRPVLRVQRGPARSALNTMCADRPGQPRPQPSPAPAQPGPSPTPTQAPVDDVVPKPLHHGTLFSRSQKKGGKNLYLRDVLSGVVRGRLQAGRPKAEQSVFARKSCPPGGGGSDDPGRPGDQSRTAHTRKILVFSWLSLGSLGGVFGGELRMSGVG